jgi:hypothetical protein
MGRLGRGQVAGLLSVLVVPGAVAVAVAAQPQAAGVLEAARQRLAIGLVNLPPPVTPDMPVCPPRTPSERPILGGRAPAGMTTGPTTCGAEIAVGGWKVQLPPDAYIEHLIISVNCVVGQPCPEAPYYSLRRGKSTVGVSIRSGARFGERIAPGEEGAFDFLGEAVP